MKSTNATGDCHNTMLVQTSTSHHFDIGVKSMCFTTVKPSRTSKFPSSIGEREKRGSAAPTCAIALQQAESLATLPPKCSADAEQAGNSFGGEEMEEADSTDEECYFESTDNFEDGVNLTAWLLIKGDCVLSGLKQFGRALGIARFFGKLQVVFSLLWQMTEAGSYRYATPRDRLYIANQVPSEFEPIVGFLAQGDNSFVTRSVIVNVDFSHYVKLAVVILGINTITLLVLLASKVLYPALAEGIKKQSVFSSFE